MTQTQQLEQIGYKAIRRLRLDKLKRGRPFMINMPELPARQCYMEYPDGKITIEQINGAGNEFETVRILSHKEATLLRDKLGLNSLHA